MRNKAYFVLPVAGLAVAAAFAVPGMAGAHDPLPPVPDAVKNLPGVPEAPVTDTTPMTLEEATEHLNPEHLKNVVVTENPDGTFQVAIYRLVNADSTPPPEPPGGYEAYDEEQQ